jgi:hypothetical protein
MVDPVVVCPVGHAFGIWLVRWAQRNQMEVVIPACPIVEDLDIPP